MLSYGVGVESTIQLQLLVRGDMNGFPNGHQINPLMPTDEVDDQALSAEEIKVQFELKFPIGMDL